MDENRHAELPASLAGLTAEQLEHVVGRYPWFTAARLALYRLTGAADRQLDLLFRSRPYPALLTLQKTLREAPVRNRTSDVIDAFLAAPPRRNAPRENAALGGEDISLESIAEDPELVSEELAEIYAKQGLYSKAKEIYTRLSLLYPEKSVYFAEIIAGFNDENRANRVQTENYKRLKVR